MNSRERVYRVINFQEPDRVPIDLGGTTGASGIHVIAYNNLKKLLGIPGHVKCYDVMQQLALVESEVRKKLNVDVIQINPLTFHEDWERISIYDCKDIDLFFPKGLAITVNKDGSKVLKNAQGTKFHMPVNSYYFDAEDGRSWFSWPYELTDDFLERLYLNTKRLYDESTYALAANFGGGFFQRDPDFLMNLLLEPKKINEQLSIKCEKLIEKYEQLNQAIGDYTFCIVFSDDFGTQKSPFISPDIFRQCIKPHYIKFTNWLHSETKWKLYLHSCGAIEPLIGDIIDMGVDILNPIQISAEGMKPELLKQKYGEKIVFWGGGCDTQNILGKVSLDELEDHVRKQINIFARGGGFVFNQVHAIQANINAEDIYAIFDTAFKYGKYPIGN